MKMSLAVRRQADATAAGAAELARALAVGEVEQPGVWPAEAARRESRPRENVREAHP
jgi:hypothetical protein